MKLAARPKVPASALALVATVVGSVSLMGANSTVNLQAVPIAAVSGCASCPVYQVPGNIDGTGASDVTQGLVSFIASVPNGSVISFTAGARYRIDDSILVSNRSSLTIEGNGATFFTNTSGYRTRSHWKFVGGSNLTLRNVKIDGANPYAGMSEAAYNSTLEAQHGVDIKGVNGFLLEGATITDVYGDFAYIGDNARVWASDVTIRNNRFERNGRQGVAITAGQNVMINNNYMSQVRRSSFDLEPNTTAGGAVNVTITANEIGPARLKLLASGGAGGRIENVVFSNNTVGRPLQIYMVAPSGSRRSGFQVTGNKSTVTTNVSPLFIVTRVSGLVVSGNTQVFAGKGYDTDPVINLKESCASIGANNFQNKTWIVQTDGYKCG